MTVVTKDKWLPKWQRQVEFCDSEANLVYTVNFKPAKATIMIPCHKTKQKNTKKEECLYIITKFGT